MTSEMDTSAASIVEMRRMLRLHPAYVGTGEMANALIDALAAERDDLLASVARPHDKADDALRRCDEKARGLADVAAARNALAAKYAVVNECHENALRLVRETLAERDAARAEAARLREAGLDALASLVAAHSLLKAGGKKAAPSDKMFAQMLRDYKASINRARAALAQKEG